MLAVHAVLRKNIQTQSAASVCEPEILADACLKGEQKQFMKKFRHLTELFHCLRMKNFCPFYHFFFISGLK